jgi:hypothetical protein
MEIEKEALVSLNKDDQSIALGELQELYSAVVEVYNRLKNNQLTEKMRDCLLPIIEHHIAEASEILGFDSNSAKNIKERHADLRQANLRIHELEQLLAQKTSIVGLKELFHSIEMALYDWWKGFGFNLVTDHEFGFFGYKGRFCLDTRTISFAARQPVTDEIANRLGEMIDEGFEFEQEDRDEYVLLDTQNNRDKVDKILKSKFKSARIVEWHNHLIHEKNNFRLRDFIAYIGNLSELKELMMERSVSNNE